MVNNGNSSVEILSDALFCVEGDSVYFRGLDTNRSWDGYACPLFPIWTAAIVARYISTPTRKIRYDRNEETFCITIKGDNVKYLLQKVEIDNNFYFDFIGTERWVSS